MGEELKLYEQVQLIEGAFDEAIKHIASLRKCPVCVGYDCAYSSKQEKSFNDNCPYKNEFTDPDLMYETCWRVHLKDKALGKVRNI